MRAGDTVLMLFKGDTQPTPIPVKRIAEARASGANFYKRPMVARALDSLPTVGGMAGGIAGGVIGSPAVALGPAGVLVPAAMGVAGSGMGGALGQEARDLGYRAMGYGPAPGSIGNASREQATYGAMGEGIGTLANAVARPLMSHAMGSPIVPPGAINPVEENLRNVRAPVGKTFGAPGSAKAIAARKASSATLDSHLTELANAGHTVDASAAIDRAYQKLSSEMAHDATGRSEQQLSELYNETIARHGKQLDPRMANLLKQRWDRASAPILKAVERVKKGGPLPDPTSAATAQWDKALADEMRAEIEATSSRATGAIPSPAEAINAVTARKIGVQNAIRGAESARRHVSPIVTGIGGIAAGTAGGLEGHSVGSAGVPAILGALASHALTQPEATSRMALWASDPYMQMLLRQSPRFAAGALNQGNK